ncbi:hypothetical protein [Streptacidiphilus sp. EB129]|uniref:hypothetical protein n=1 Tax=Streptacidiphilus sp. EB129 TaxID=3156262 RepID=UPI0035164B8A
MAQSAGSSQNQPSARAPHDFPLSSVVQRNSDGKPHPLQDTLAGITVVLAAIAISTCMFRGLHLLASWTGLIGVFTAAYGQYISATTAERFVLVVAGVACAVGFGIGLAHGGLFGGVFG